MTRFALVLAALLLAPTAQAGWLGPDVEIAIPHLRVGDAFRYDIGTDAGEQTLVVLVETQARVPDRFGIERDTVPLRSDYLINGTVEFSDRCHTLLGGNETVLLQPLGESTTNGWEASWGGTVELYESRVTTALVPLAYHPSGTCAAAPFLVGRTLREGETLAMDDLLTVHSSRPGRSAPARAVEFAGRDALAFDFSWADIYGGEGEGAGATGTTTLVFADGIPGFARIVYRGAGVAGPVDNEVALTGFTRGSGPELPLGMGASLPERHPTAALGAPAPRALDDRGLVEDLPYADAYAAALADERTGLAGWLRAHPQAVLVHALYRPDGMDGSAQAGLRQQADWSMTFADATGEKSVGVTAYDGVESPVGPLGAPQRVVVARDGGELPAVDRPLDLPGEIASGADLAKLVAAAGIAQVVTLEWSLAVLDGEPAVELIASDTADTDGAQGRIVAIDAARGAIEVVYAAKVEREDSGLLATPSSLSGADGASAPGAAASPLVGPAGIGVVAGGATATAILLLVLKFLVIPFYTRLRRDRLLDNPVRARLYERIRAEPGIHRAELVDFAGVGEGATRHHLQQLASHRLLVELEQDGFVRYFCAGEVPPEAARREAVLRAGRAREVYELLRANPGMSLREAGARLSMSAPSVFRVKRKLEKAGLLPAAPEAGAALA